MFHTYSFTKCTSMDCGRKPEYLDMRRTLAEPCCSANLVVECLRLHLQHKLTNEEQRNVVAIYTVILVTLQYMYIETHTRACDFRRDFPEHIPQQLTDILYNLIMG